MNMVGLHAAGMVGIRYYSTDNPWIDFVVYVSEGGVEHIAKRIRKAMCEFWNDEWETYGDAVANALRGRVAFVIFHDSEDESDEYEEAWETMVAETKVALVIHSSETWGD